MAGKIDKYEYEYEIRRREFLGRGVEESDREEELRFLERLREQATPPNTVTPDGHADWPEEEGPS